MPSLQGILPILDELKKINNCLTFETVLARCLGQKISRNYIVTVAVLGYGRFKKVRVILRAYNKTRHHFIE